VQIAHFIGFMRFLCSLLRLCAVTIWLDSR